MIRIPTIYPTIFNVLAVFAFELPRKIKPLSKLFLALSEKISAGIPVIQKILIKKLINFKN
jgi:hypothetical protein